MRKQVGSKLGALLKFSSVCASLFFHLNKIDSNYFTEMALPFFVVNF